jgi:phosphodiesterase/alkaline phosphatase D-like protein
MHTKERSTAGRLGAAVLVVGIVLLSAVVGAATAASAPTAITGPVSAVGSTSATVTGTVNPNGQATTWYFEYGTSTSYGSKTSTMNAGSGTSNVDASATLSGLAPGTTYHYRLVATSSAGTSRGADGIFTTSSSPAAVTGSATDVRATSATLNGTVDPNGRSTTWSFEYGTSTSYGSKTPGKSAGAGTSPVSVAAAVSGLTPGRLYHYRLVATSDAGTSRGADHTFSTSSAPTAVTGSATSIGPTSATLNGTVNPNGQATTWYFEFGTSTSYGSRTPAKGAGSGTSPMNVSASLTGLKAATSYHYRLVATNASGTSFGSDQTFSTSFPPVPRTGPAQDVGGTTATLTGSVDPKGRPTTWYFEYGTTTGYGPKTPVQSAGSGTGDHNVAAPISALAPGTTYHYRLIATSDAGMSRGADLSFTTAAVTLTASTLRIIYGRSVTLSGTVSSKQAGEKVTVLAQRFGESSFSSIATLTTGAGGTWSYPTRPTIRTLYEASWKNATSSPTAVGVRPLVSFHVITRARFSTRVVAARSFAGRFVQLQRRSARRWVTVKRVRLGLRSAAIFRASLRGGTSTLRVVMSVNQAGAGYLAGISRTIVYHRG